MHYFVEVGREREREENQIHEIINKFPSKYLQPIHLITKVVKVSWNLEMFLANLFGLLKKKWISPKTKAINFTIIMIWKLLLIIKNKRDNSQFKWAIDTFYGNENQFLKFLHRLFLLCIIFLLSHHRFYYLKLLNFCAQNFIKFIHFVEHNNCRI